MPSVPSGQCRRCGRTVRKNQASSHLLACLGPGRELLIKAEAPRSPYFTYFTAPRGTTWQALDDALRDLWVECCDHLSAFTIGDNSFESEVFDPGPFPLSRRRHRAMNSPILRGTPVNEKIVYEYDFGTTTELVLIVVADGVNGLASDRIKLAARNAAPTYPCEQCGKPASVMVGWDRRTYCGTCQDALPNAEREIEWPILNSPRVGICGYTGPSLEPE